MGSIDWDDYPDTACICGFNDVSFPHSCEIFAKTKCNTQAELFRFFKEEEIKPQEKTSEIGVI